MSNEFSGKTAIISGGAGGIGFALAEEFGQLGMNIVIADIDQTQLAEAEQKIGAVQCHTLNGTRLHTVLSFCCRSHRAYVFDS